MACTRRRSDLARAPAAICSWARTSPVHRRPSCFPEALARIPGRLSDKREPEPEYRHSPDAFRSRALPVPPPLLGSCRENLLTTAAVGVGIYLLSPLLRPLAKTAIKGGIVAYDWAANTVTEVMEEAREAPGEAAAGEHEARRRESAVAARAAAQKPSEPKPATP